LNVIGGRPPENASPAEKEAHLQHQQEYGERGDPLVAAAVQRLEHGGFIVRASVMGGNRLDVTSLGKLLLEALE